MNRKILIAAAVALGSVYSFACGGSNDTGNTNTTPTNSATMTAPTMTATDTAMPSTTDTGSAMATTSATEAPKPKTLYERLGGKDGVAKVVDDFLAIVKDDKRINHFFAKVVADKSGKKMDALKASINDFVCKATDGGCDYKGKDMKEAHKGMKVKDADFDAFMEDFGKALDKENVDASAKSDLVNAMNGMKADIVAAGPAPKGSATGKSTAAPPTPKSSK